MVSTMQRKAKDKGAIDLLRPFGPEVSPFRGSANFDGNDPKFLQSVKFCQIR